MIEGPYIEFGIIDCIDSEKDYANFLPDESFQDKLQEYHCVALPDEITDAWWGRLMTMQSYFHELSRPSTALAQYGVTLIPPDSLELFYCIVMNDTAEEYKNGCADELIVLLELIKRAQKENKFMIHFGV